jgi:hypothetical protein
LPVVALIADEFGAYLDVAVGVGVGAGDGLQPEFGARQCLLPAGHARGLPDRRG